MIYSVKLTLVFMPSSASPYSIGGGRQCPDPILAMAEHGPRASILFEFVGCQFWSTCVFYLKIRLHY